jgi:hypothetical protein
VTGPRSFCTSRLLRESSAHIKLSDCTQTQTHTDTDTHTHTDTDTHRRGGSISCRKDYFRSFCFFIDFWPSTSSKVSQARSCTVHNWWLPIYKSIKQGLTQFWPSTSQVSQARSCTVHNWWLPIYKSIKQGLAQFWPSTSLSSKVLHSSQLVATHLQVYQARSCTLLAIYKSLKQGLAQFTTGGYSCALNIEGSCKQLAIATGRFPRAASDDSRTVTPPADSNQSQYKSFAHFTSLARMPAMRSRAWVGMCIRAA